MNKSKLTVIGKRCLSSTLITAMLLGCFAATDIYYGYSPYTVKASTITRLGE